MPTERLQVLIRMWDLTPTATIPEVTLPTSTVRMTAIGMRQVPAADWAAAVRSVVAGSSPETVVAHVDQAALRVNVASLYVAAVVHDPHRVVLSPYVRSSGMEAEEWHDGVCTYGWAATVRTLIYLIDAFRDDILFGHEQLMAGLAAQSGGVVDLEHYSGSVARIGATPIETVKGEMYYRQIEDSVIVADALGEDRPSE